MGDLAGLALTTVVLGVGIINTWTADSGNTNEQRIIKTLVQIGSAASNMVVGTAAVVVATGGTTLTAGLGTVPSLIAGGVVMLGGYSIVNNYKQAAYEKYDIN